MVIIYEIGKGVPLHESRVGATTVFISTIVHRVGEGQRVATLLTQGVREKKVDAWKAAFEAPFPSYAPKTTFQAYWEAQAFALMYPGTKNAFNEGTITEENVDKYVSKFVKLDTFADVPLKVYIHTILLLGQAMDRDPVYTLTYYNYERLILAAFIVALKDIEGSDYNPRNFVAAFGKIGEDVDKLDSEFRRLIGNATLLSEDEYFHFNCDIMFDVLDSAEHSTVLPKLRKENIMGLNGVLEEFHIQGDRRTPPKILDNPAKVGDEYRGILVSSPAQAESLNRTNLAKCVDDWRIEKIKGAERRLEAYVRVIKKHAPNIRVAKKPRSPDSSFS